MKVELTIKIDNPKGDITPENIKDILLYINENILDSYIKDDNKFYKFMSITNNQSNLDNISFSTKCIENNET